MIARSNQTVRQIVRLEILEILKNLGNVAVMTQTVERVARNCSLTGRYPRVDLCKVLGAYQHQMHIHKVNTDQTIAIGRCWYSQTGSRLPTRTTKPPVATKDLA